MTGDGIRCASAPNRRGRPVGTKTLAIRDAVLELADQHDEMTVRGVFYALVSRGVVPKDENAGYRPVQTQIVKMRREGILRWSFVADGTRWQRKPETWDSVEDATAELARTYRRNHWRRHGVRIEVWLEKDALGSVVARETNAWDVPLMVSRGQSSVTFLHSAAQVARDAWESAEVETVVYALYDHDAGGKRAARAIERDLRGFAPGVPITFQLLAVTEEQIDQYNLPTRPAKRSDPEAHKFRGRSVELDALDPSVLRGIVQEAIVSHIDPAAWRMEQAVEEQERQLLERLAGRGPH